MIAKKICMVGAFAVGKTSLVRQFVESLFSEKYHTTIGVKIDKKTVEVKDGSVQLMIWDIEGVDVFTELNPSYLRGASGILLVVDGTRPKTLDAAIEIKRIIDDTLDNPHYLLLLNKCDLDAQWFCKPDKLPEFDIDADCIFTTSAKTGQNVEEAFAKMAERLLSAQLTG